MKTHASVGYRYRYTVSVQSKRLVVSIDRNLADLLATTLGLDPFAQPGQARQGVRQWLQTQIDARKGYVTFHAEAKVRGPLNTQSLERQMLRALVPELVDRMEDMELRAIERGQKTL